MINSKKKGFTIVELVIVIAVIAILAAVLIPTFSNLVKKANVSNDTALVKNLNTALAADVDGQDTMYDALQAAKEFGYDIAKIQAKANGNKILWDSKNDCFVYLNDGQKQYIPDSKKESAADSDLWVISNVVDETYSTYLYGYEGTEVTAKFGLDTGECAIEIVNANGLQGEVIIRTTGGTLKIDSPQATINHYGSAQEVYVIDVYSSTYNLYGSAGYIEVTEGEHVVLKQGSSVTAVYAPNANVEVENGQSDAVHAEGNKDDIKASATKFVGGLGTKEKPYLIANVEHLLNIDALYEDGFKYYEIANDVKTLDLANLSANVRIKLHGSFNGNNATIINLSTALFWEVGYKNNAEDIVISNMTVYMNNNQGRALVRNIFNSGKTKFENIKLYGYVSGDYNMGSFYNYGTANRSDSDGADYTVEFKNCQSDLTLVCTTGNAMGGLLGHGFEGANNILTIIKDQATKYTGKMYSTGTATCYEVMAMCSHATYILNGEETSRYVNTYPSTKIEKGTVDKKENGYEVLVATGASKLIIDLNCQLSAYDEAGNQIPNLSGMTWVLQSNEKEVTSGKEVKVLDLVESLNIVNGTNYEHSASISNKVLTIYTGKDSNYASGTVTLYVKHIDSRGNIIRVDSIQVVTIE